MESRDFVYWLQGFFEISGATTVSPKQLEIIRRHLDMVFVHEIDISDLNKTEVKPKKENQDVLRFDPRHLPGIRVEDNDQRIKC